MERYLRENHNEDYLKFQLATDIQKRNEALLCGDGESMREINRDIREKLSALNSIDSNEYSYTDTL
jgi:hypothetical protein